jgi:hypothetical protein
MGNVIALVVSAWVLMEDTYPKVSNIILQFMQFSTFILFYFQCQLMYKLRMQYL